MAERFWELMRGDDVAAVGEVLADGFVLEGRTRTSGSAGVTASPPSTPTAEHFSRLSSLQQAETSQKSLPNGAQPAQVLVRPAEVRGQTPVRARSVIAA
jgi:hypothetical protein